MISLDQAPRESWVGGGALSRGLLLSFLCPRICPVSPPVTVWVRTEVGETGCQWKRLTPTVPVLPNPGVIAGAIVGVVLFLILVGLLVFFLKKRWDSSQG